MKNEIIKLAIDAIRHNVAGTYSSQDVSKTLREAFKEANGGSDKITIKSFRNNPELYEIIETIIPTLIDEGLKGDEFFMNYVDYRNLALGDDEDFWAEDRSLFLVSDIAEGTQAVRRQRLNIGEKVNITKTLKVIKVYEELNRLLAGRVDFNSFVNKVSKSMLNEVYTDIYTVFNSISSSTSGMTSDYAKSGSFAEDTLLELIDHVEAANNANATIVGTRSALRKITTAVVSDAAKNDMYNFGFYGKFNGVPMFVAKQRHTANTDTFVLDTDKVYVIANNDKFIKHVTVGEGMLVDGDPMSKMDLTKEYLYGERNGTGILIAGRMGIYDIT
jgi:hypothetical protein